MRASGWVWLALATGLLWWHAAGASTRAFAVADRPWGWTSHLTSFYFQRASTLVDTLSRQLVRLEPDVTPGMVRLEWSPTPGALAYDMI